MEGENKVILHGTRFSPLVKRVELALRLKGVAFEFVEEDLKNKSPELLKHNPVYKQVPVLVHNGKAIAETPIILEYIDENWKNNSPHLLPQDPYKRAKVRFWATFIQQELFQNMKTAITTDGEVQEKALKELEKVGLLEEGMKEFFPDGNPSISSETVGILDIVFFTCFGSHKVEEEVLGIKIIDPEKTPLLFSWVTAINQVPLMKEFTPPHDKLVGFLKNMRANALKSSATN
ncbi:hypothetical protein COLO4_28323 [Corchorus olitorius]|uniref:Glutathione S-transferase n=1 Tax=Corchorus olitorius TaxID=93759 RepID=A0A1R3HLU0_9ROSI|nr:hypothetical protein COLO4_28323 [Corchorus olitorius]